MPIPTRYFDLGMEVPEGDPIIIPMVFKDENSDPVDITDWDFFYTIKADLDDSDDDAIAKLRPGDPGIVKSEYPTGLGTTNRVDLIVEAAALTGLARDTEYFHDVQVIPDDGRPYTYAKGILSVSYEVTEDVT
jgi:hypothetical protein